MYLGILFLSVLVFFVAQFYINTIHTREKQLAIKTDELAISNEHLSNKSEELSITNEQLNTAYYEVSIINEQLTDAHRELSISNEQLSISNNTKDKFFSIIAHDLRNPIAAMINISSMFEDNFSKMSANQTEKGIKMLTKSTNHIATLLDNLLN